MFRLRFFCFFIICLGKNKKTLGEAYVFRKIIEIAKRNHDFQRNACVSYVFCLFLNEKHENTHTHTKKKNLKSNMSLHGNTKQL